jgi:acyl-CoA synthetase (AMP-forming)/AMP-acid ligase II
MPEPQAKPRSLLDALAGIASPSGRLLSAPDASLALDALAHGTSLGGALARLHGRSVLVATGRQLAAALALVELDGVARRLILCPPGLPADHLAHVIAGAGVDALVSDADGAAPADGGGALHVRVRPAISPTQAAVIRDQRTEWVMLTSGTTGAPKMVVHGLASLTAAIPGSATATLPMVWGTLYDIRRFGGLQIFLRSVLGGAALVLSDAGESTGLYLARAAALGVTHVSGTPSQWRSALVYESSRAISPRYVRLSGEIADQAILDSLRERYPQAQVSHAYASTESGVGFEVDDGREGFTVDLIGPDRDGVAMNIRDGSLCIRSARAASRYVGIGAPLADADGFIDTGDLVERRGGRCYFVGRRGGIINVGGLKVHPEEVEAVINRHPDVRASLVRSRKNLITGQIVVADVVLRTDCADAGALDRSAEVKREILASCRGALANYKVPAAIRFVAALEMAATGKPVRT